MAGPGFALLMAMQTSSMPVALPTSPSIWSPPRSIPAPAPSLPIAHTGATESAGGVAVQVRRLITAELRSGEISHAQARAFRRDVAAFDGCAVGGLNTIEGVQSVTSLEALSSLIYAAGSPIAPK
jgi:hypothetical protein